MARSVVLLVLCALVAPVLAGCLGADDDGDDLVAPGRTFTPPELRAPLTEPIYEILGHFEHSFTGTTGTELYIDYYLPDVPDGVLAPVILVFTPYQRADPDEVAPGATDDLFGSTTWAYDPTLVDYFVPRGYGLAFADVRGNHQAGGCIDQTGPEQWQDGYDYVEWLGTQEWSNGKVGMIGVSYDAETQFTTAMMAPPHLATIVPMASVSNQYEWNFYNGVPYEGQPLTGMSGYFAFSAVPSADPMDAAHWPEKLECQQQQFENGVDFSGDYTTFWQERDYRPMAKDIEASVLHVHGLADWNVRPIHIDPLFNDIVSEKRALFGQWGHSHPQRADAGDLVHAWYDHFLMGLDNGILDILPPVLIQADDGEWYGIDSFPPHAQPWMQLHLSGDGTLVAPGEAEAGTFTIRDIPEETPAAGPTDGGAVVARATGDATSVSFLFETSEALQLVGRPVVEFTATSDKASTHWVAELNVLGPAGMGLPLDVAKAGWQNSGFQDTRHLAGLDQPADLTPGAEYRVTIPMYPQWDVIPARATLELRLTNNNADVQQDPTDATNTIFVGGDSHALLRLPLAPIAVPLPADSLPDIYPGYLVDA